MVAEAPQHVQPWIGGGQHRAGEQRPQGRQPWVREHRVDSAAVPATDYGFQIVDERQQGHRRELRVGEGFVDVEGRIEAPFE